MELIKDHSKFKEQTIFLTTSVKQAWEIATTLACSAVAHFIETKDASWCAEAMECFQNASGQFDKAFIVLIRKATDVKFRQDETDLGKVLTAIRKGSIPDDHAEQLALCQKHGLKDFANIKGKSKRVAAYLNRDFQPNPNSTRKSSGADVITLQTTDFGDKLVESAKLADGMTEEQKKLAEQVAAQTEQTMRAIREGKLTSLPNTSTADDGTTFAMDGGDPFDFLDGVFAAAVSIPVTSALEKIRELESLQPGACAGSLKALNDQLDQRLGKLKKDHAA